MNKLLLTLAIFTISTASISAQSLIKAGEKVELIAKGYMFLEGPTPDKDGNVYFSDIPNNTIFKCDLTNQISTFMQVKGCNGLKFDKKGNLWVCGAETGRNIYYITPEKETKIIVEKYAQKRFNSPNDLWLSPNGTLYFTDPFYAGKKYAKELSFDGVYYVKQNKRKAILIDSTFAKPNGIIGTLDGKTLYVADHENEKTYKFEISKNGSLKNKQLFCEVGSDGVALDEKGNLYLTSKGIHIFAPDGTKLEFITLPARPTNVCFGGNDGKTLFITTPNALYALKMDVKGLGR